MSLKTFGKKTLKVIKKGAKGIENFRVAQQKRKADAFEERKKNIAFQEKEMSLMEREERLRKRKKKMQGDSSSGSGIIGGSGFL